MKRLWLLILFTILFIFITYPSAFIYSKDTLPDSNDTRLIAYIIGQMQENMTSGKNLFFGRFFAPDQNTLAYSEPFIVTSLLTLPFRMFTDSPIQILNIGFVLNFVLTIIISLLLFKYIIKDPWLSIFATIIFNFSGFHLHYYSHMQIFSFWLPCLAIYFFLRYQDESNNHFLNLFLLTATAQLAESIFSFYLIFFAVFFLFWRRKDQYKQIIFSTLFAVPLWLTILYPYISLRLAYPEATRSIRDAAHFSLGLDQFFTFYNSWTVITIFLIITLTEVTLLKKNNSQARIKKLTHVLLATLRRHELLGFLRSKKIHVENRDNFRSQEAENYRWPKKNVGEVLSKPFIYLFCFALTMSLGPVLKIFGRTVKIFGLPIPLPYTLFYYLFPGFQGFRTPSRFIILTLLATSILIGIWLYPIFQKLQNKTKFVLILLVFSFLLFEADLPLKGYPVNINMHPVYTEVAKLPKESVIIELPVKLWNMPDHEIESIRSLYSLTHKHRRFGGFSGFATNTWIDLVEKINTYGLDEENTAKLKEIGVTHKIENNRLYPL